MLRALFTKAPSLRTRPQRALASFVAAYGLPSAPLPESEGVEIPPAPFDVQVGRGEVGPQEVLKRLKAAELKDESELVQLLPALCDAFVRAKWVADDEAKESLLTLLQSFSSPPTPSHPSVAASLILIQGLLSESDPAWLANENLEKWFGVCSLQECDLEESDVFRLRMALHYEGVRAALRVMGGTAKGFVNCVVKQASLREPLQSDDPGRPPLLSLNDLRPGKETEFLREVEKEVAEALRHAEVFVEEGRWLDSCLLPLVAHLKEGEVGVLVAPPQCSPLVGWKAEMGERMGLKMLVVKEEEVLTKTGVLERAEWLQTKVKALLP